MLFIQLFFFCIIGCMDFFKHVCVLSREDRKHLPHGYHMGLLSKYSKLYTQRKNKHLFFFLFFFFKHTQTTLKGKYAFYTSGECRWSWREASDTVNMLHVCKNQSGKQTADVVSRGWGALFAFRAVHIWRQKLTHHYVWFLFPSSAFRSPRFTFLSYSRGAFSLTRALSWSPSIPPPLFSPSSFSFFFISFSLPSLSLVRSFLCHSTRRGSMAGARRLLSPASLLRFGCSCWAVIKRVKKRSFHTNYQTIMKCSAKGTGEMKVTLALILSE